MFCSSACQISTGTVMPREVPIFLYPKGREGNIQLSVSPDITVSAWKDEGMRPWTVRVLLRQWLT